MMMIRKEEFVAVVNPSFHIYSVVLFSVTGSFTD